MELLETQDPDKKKLIEDSERHKRELEREMEQIGERTQRILTNALVIGGVLALSYLVVSQLWGGQSKKAKAKKKGSNNAAMDEPATEEVEVEEKSTLLAEIGNKVINQATIILIDIARQKLADYLEGRKPKNDAS